MSVTAGPTRTGIANLPLHHGKAPRWLFDRMTRLGTREKNEAMKRLASFGTKIS